MPSLGRARTRAQERLLSAWSSARGWLVRSVTQWAAILVLVSVLLVAPVVLGLRPAPGQAARLGISLALCSLTSVALLLGARWVLGRPRMTSVQVQVGVPFLLAALVIAANVVLLARLLFASLVDVQLLIVFLAFGVTVALALSSPLAGRVTRAITTIERGAGHIASGEYAFRFEEAEARTAQDLTRLSHLINQIASGLQEADQGRHAAEAHRQRLVTALSHDLRTPLTAIQALVEAITEHIVTDPATLERYHQTLVSEVGHLSTLVDDWFELTRLESGIFILEREPVRVEDLLTPALAAVRARAEQGHIALRCDLDEALPVLTVDAKRMARVFASLLQNAIRYSCPGGTVQICAGVTTAQDGRSDMLIRVIDTGTGVAADDLPLIFEPSYRGDASRGRECGPVGMTSAETAAGLGLSIAARIVEAHGGRIWVVSPLPPDVGAELDAAGGCSSAGETVTGTMLCFTLPVLRPPESGETLRIPPPRQSPAAT